jgi:hypothetical protein
MKHKRDELGFSVHLILAVLIIAATTGFAGWYIVNRHKSVDQNSSNSEDYVPGAIEITFRDGTTFQEAKQLINSFNLNIDKPDSVYEQSFTPWDYRSIKADQFDQIGNKLRAFSEVNSFVDASNDGTSRAGLQMGKDYF